MDILLIEDESDLAAALRVGLAAEGYSVDVCHDGPSGLRLAVAGRYDAIVLDLLLPHMSGYRVLDRLRRAGVTTPVIVLTALSGEVDHTDALDGGADDVMTKPFSFIMLLARLRAVIRRSTPDAVEVGVGDLHVHRVDRRVRRGEVEIALTTREFGVVEELALASSSPVTKGELLARLWPEGAEDLNLVEARIVAIRRKIDAPFRAHSLETVRGVGYRLVDDRSRRGI